MAFFRYPGGKRKLRKKIISALKKQIPLGEYEYREPFFGGGSIGLELLKDADNIHNFYVNDFDPGIAAIWTAVINHPELLIEKILSYTPQVEDFNIFKIDLLAATMPTTPSNIVDLAFKKIAIHQISYSGLGTKSGGPLGGQQQKSKYKIDCRWSPSHMVKKIQVLHESLAAVNARCTNDDFLLSIHDPSIYPVLIYLDPPYYIQGTSLYQCGFEKDHERLAESLKDTTHAWVLSYDDCPEIRDLYQWANIETTSVGYSINAKKTSEGRESIMKDELIISPK